MKAIIFVIIVISLSVGFIAGYLVKNSVSIPTSLTSESCEAKYEFINSRLGCQPASRIEKREYTEFMSELEDYINQEKKAKHISHVSVYFRDLNAGPTFGINSQEKFAPASLLKLPLLLAYYGLADEDSSILNKQTSFKKVVSGVKQETNNIPQLEPNKKYKIEDLLSRMIIYSDNISYWVLLDYLNKAYPQEDQFIKTLKELGLINPRTAIENTITVKSYASLFRHLYNSSYVSPQMSEKALSLLVQSKYVEGLEAGIPNGIKVAHKFGEIEGLPNNERQLHDCGIIYYSENPYLLCVMTRGDNFNEQVNVIKSISEKVYKEVDSRQIQ